MKKIVSLLIFVSCIFWVSSGYAEIRAGSTSLSACVGGYTFEGDEDLKTGPVYGLRAGYNFTENIGIEGYANLIKSEFKDSAHFVGPPINGNPDMDLYSYGVEGIWHFMPGSRLVPFLAVGAGVTHYNAEVAGEYVPELDNRNKFTFEYGGGLKYFLTDNLALRADVRHVIPFNDSYHNLLYTLGINFNFGGEKKVAAAPAAEPVAEVVRDADGDGVPDNLDKCPDTPAGVKVDENGCPLDSDKDGVPDYLDKCPGTPEGVQVDNDGCPMQIKKEEAAVAKELIEKGRATVDIEFDFDKAVVKPKYHDEIKKFADVMKDHPDLNVVIEGHTDSIGAAAYNQKLSEKRAASVKDYMIKKFGVEKSRLASKGYGESKPIATNKTAQGRQKNRRVEAVVDYLIKK